MRRIKSLLVRLLLAILNSRFLNSSPCKYAFVGNIDAFSYENLRSEDAQQPGITVREVLDHADRFRCCPFYWPFTVLEDDVARPANDRDLKQLLDEFRTPRRLVR